MRFRRAIRFLRGLLFVSCMVMVADIIYFWIFGKPVGKSSVIAQVAVLMVAFLSGGVFNEFRLRQLERKNQEGKKP